MSIVFPMRQKFLCPSFKQNVSNNSVKVSVILPVYNQEKFLANAINSLQKQTLKDIEFICVNDGSQDQSLSILQKFAQKDSRVKILSQKNQGAGCARNNGLKIAKGEFVAFLDPDDWFEPDALEKLYKKAKKQNCDMVVFNFKKTDEFGNLLGKHNLKDRLRGVCNLNEQANFHWRDIKSRVLGGLFPAAWNKFYSNEFLKKNKLHFSKCSVGEDNVFVFGSTLKAKSIGYSDEYLYNYLIHKNSALHTRSNQKLCIFKSVDSVKKLITDMGLMNELQQEYDRYVLRMVSFLSRKVETLSKLKDVCKRKLSAQQYSMLQERFLANSKLLPILNALLARKVKI